MNFESYSTQIESLNLAQFENLTVSDIAEAKQALANIRNTQKRLRQIKREINVDMKAIRAGFEQRKVDAGSGGSAFLTVLGKRKLAGSYRAGKKRQLNQEREQALAPLSDLKLAIDKALVGFDEMKLQLNAYIEEAKLNTAAKNETKPAQTMCPKCGNPAEDDDEFCRKCGHKLSVTDEILPPPMIYPPGMLGGN